MNFGGFSWKRLFGITGLKQKLARKTGIPYTRGGRQRKIGGFFYPGGRKSKTKSGCLVLFVIPVLYVLLV